LAHGSETTEESLVAQTAKGDRDAFEQLYLNYRKRLFGYLYRMVGDAGGAEDLAHEVLLEIWKSAGRFEGRSKVSSWIFGIAHNKARAAMRKRRPTVDLDHAPELPDLREDVDAALERNEMRTLFRKYLTALSGDHREVIELAFLQGLSYAECAEILDCPVATVKTRVFYAKQQLKSLASGYGAL
jgi:RNA polymerase sigma-70 factor (ECF subfamily)